MNNSPLIPVINTISSNTTFDANLAFIRTGIYLKCRQGSTLDNDGLPKNNYAIAVGAETPEIMLELTPEGNLKIKQLTINDILQHSFTLSDLNKVNQNTTDITNINTNLDNAFIFNTTETTSNYL